MSAPRICRSGAATCCVTLVLFEIRPFLFGLRHKSAVEITPSRACSRTAARAAARERSASGFSESFDRCSDCGRDLRGGGNVRGENSKLALPFESRMYFGLRVFESLDACEQCAGRAY